MEIIELQSVLTVSIEKNYEEAAEKSNYSLSTIAKHVHRVEEELGVKLFNRAAKGKSLSCTEHGEIIVKQIARLLAEYDKIRIYTNSIAVENNNSLSILSLPLDGAYFESMVLAEFYLSHPEVSVVPEQTSTSNIIKLISEGRADGGFLIIPGLKDIANAVRQFCAQDGISVIPISSNRHPLLIRSKNHLLGSKKEIILSDLCHETIYMNKSFMYPSNKNAYSTPYLYAELERHNLHKNIKWVDIHVGGGLLEILGKGEGVYISTYIFSSEISGIVSTPVTEIFQPTALVFAYSRYNLSPALKKFREVCVKFSKKHYEDIPDMGITY